MFGSAAIEVLIGLVFVYFIFSLVCSKINEHLASALRWRARNLEDGLCQLLNSQDGGPRLSDRFFAHPTIRALVDPGRHRPLVARLAGWAKKAWGVRRVVPKGDIQASVPSYLAPRTFATVVTTLLTPAGQAVPDVGRLPEDHPLKEVLDRAGNDAEAIRKALEQYFDDAMDRVAGWYKRQVQKALTVLAFVIAVAFNVDSVAIARTLWTDPAVRAAVVELAENTTTTTTAPASSSTDSGSSTTTATTSTTIDIRRVAEDIRKETGLPLGWRTAPWEDFDDRRKRLPVKLAGLTITALALTLGAPFWFDALNKVSQLRSTGKKPDKTKETEEPADG